MNKRKPDAAVLSQNFKSLGRVFRMLFRFYPRLAPLTVFCILFSAVVSAIPSLFIQNVLAIVENWYRSGDWNSARPEILRYIIILGVLYSISLLTMTLYTQIMAYMTQGFLDKLRCEMFNGMQDLPIVYFDTHKHGDIMSHYTNDIDTLRQLVSQAFPTLIQSGAIVLAVFAIMLYFSIWLTLVLMLGIVAMFYVTKVVGGGSARYFMRQQQATGAMEGIAQEMMNGQKVIKVFNHEDESIRDFDRVNNELYEVSRKAHSYASILGPIMANIGNVLYVVLALVGGVFLLSGVKNVSLSGMPFSISILVPFLSMAKQFAGNVNNLSQQFNAIVMAGAGAARVFSLIDEKPESDDGYVTLVNVKKADEQTEGVFRMERPEQQDTASAKDDKDETQAAEYYVETKERTGCWAWRHPHGDGSVTYTPLRGEVRLNDVDFAYEKGKDVLHDVSVYAEPGQKVAFVGATGAGKTTITNLINRFYDIADGKIRYDGINVNKIKKKDLRRSLGLVLQDTWLFTGTVMDNIRYGRLDATDKECIEAARLAGADDFITRLPEAYNTMLQNNGANLSQGQRQLIAIARAAVADPPVMILDEATSSIDTRTEAIVQRGMDKLMEGRSVFVIAHRLSTVMNSDVIMVLDHGRIIERGSHAKLIAQKGTYYQLYTGAFELE